MKSSNNVQEEKIEALKKRFYANKHKPFRKSGLYALILFLFAVFFSVYM